MIGVICAIPHEYEAIKIKLSCVEEASLSSLKLCTGRVGENQAVVVQAGVGKVNAALAACLIYHKYPVSLFISAGIAGIINKNLSIGDIVIGAEACYHDYISCKPGKNKVGDDIFGMDRAVAEDILRILSDKVQGLPYKFKGEDKDKPHITLGRIISGDTPVIKDEKAQLLFNKHQVHCVDMEACGVAQCCAILNVPGTAVKIMSDYANEFSMFYIARHIDDLCNYLGDIVSVLIGEIELNN